MKIKSWCNYLTKSNILKLVIITEVLKLTYFLNWLVIVQTHKEFL